MDCSMDCEVCFLSTVKPFFGEASMWLERERYAKSCDLGIENGSCRGRQIFIFTATLKRDQEWIGIVSFLGSRRHRHLFFQKPISVPFCRLVSSKAHAGGILGGRATSLVLSLASASSRRRHSGTRSWALWDGPQDGRLLAFCGGTSCRSPVPADGYPTDDHALHRWPMRVSVAL